MVDRYPVIEPYDSGMLAVGDGHELYWETVGDPSGIPALWLHGGPGSGSGPGHRRIFDPAKFRAVLFDQRGCGRSRPLADTAAADLSANTTDHLLRDIEQLRDHLAIEQWVVTGGSWGVTLALAYAQRHPERVTAMALAAVTAGRRGETEWITRDLRRVFPREWDAFASVVPVPDRDGDLSTAYARLLAHPDPTVTEEAALKLVPMGGHARLARPRGDTVAPAPGQDVPAGLRPTGHALLEPWLLPGRHPDPVQHGPHRPHPRGADPRTLRRLRPAGHRLGPAPGLARIAVRRRG